MHDVTPALLTELETQIGYEFHKKDLLSQALTHKSFANEQAAVEGRVRGDNERLEFLGDAVLDLALSEALMKRFPKDTEGALSKKRASLVNEDTLCLIAIELKLADVIRLGKGEAKTGGLQKPRILASTLEALFGGILIDQGYPFAYAVAEKIFGARLEELGQTNCDYQLDYKTRLQERVQEIHRATPTYQIEQESGPDHAKVFEVTARIGDQVLAKGHGRSKKAAEQDAARESLLLLEGRFEQATQTIENKDSVPPIHAESKTKDQVDV